MPGEPTFTWDALDDLVDDLREMETAPGYGAYDELALDWNQMREKIEAYVSTRLATENKALEARVGELEETLRYINDKCTLYGPADQAREKIRKALEKA